MTDETRAEQMARLRRELAELRPPLNEQEQTRLLEILDEMDEMREWLEATERAGRVPPKPDNSAH